VRVLCCLWERIIRLLGYLWDSFVRVLGHWRDSAALAWTRRETLGVLAMGKVRGQLRESLVDHVTLGAAHSELRRDTRKSLSRIQNGLSCLAKGAGNYTKLVCVASVCNDIMCREGKDVYNIPSV
jgi:hypothetical protein